MVGSSQRTTPQLPGYDSKLATSSGKKKLMESELEGSKMQSELQGFLTERDNEEDQALDQEKARLDGGAKDGQLAEKKESNLD